MHHGIGMPQERQDTTDLFYGPGDLYNILKSRISVQAQAFRLTEHGTVLNDEGNLQYRQLFFRLQIVEPPRIACPETKAYIIIEAKGAVIKQPSFGLDAGSDSDIVM